MAVDHYPRAAELLADPQQRDQDNHVAQAAAQALAKIKQAKPPGQDA